MKFSSSSKLESKDLLEDTIATPTQSEVSPVKSPCTGFCYLVAQNKHNIVSLYSKCVRTNDNDYYNYVKELIIIAGNRKKNNPLIHEDGEYLDSYTIKKDYPDIFPFMTFAEIGCPDEESFYIAQNNLFMQLLVIDGFVIVNRSLETFIMIRINSLSYLIIDSHQPIHGQVSIEKATHYVLKNGSYRGLVQLCIHYS